MFRRLAIEGLGGIRLDPQILFLDRLVGLQLLRGATEADLSLREDVVPVRQFQGGAQVLLDQQDRQSPVLDLAQHVHDLVDDERRKPLGGFVEQQQRRVQHQDPCNGKHLLLAS